MKKFLFWLLKLVLEPLPLLFEHLVAILCPLDVLFPRYGLKRFFAGFETGFRAFAALFRVLGWRFCLNQTYRCQNTGGKVCSLALKPFLLHSPLFFENFGGYFVSIVYIFAKIRVETFLRASQPVLRHVPHFCEHIGGHFASIGRTVAKVQAETFFRVLRHSQLIFENYGGIFSSIGCTVALLQAETFIRGLLNRFQVIRHTFLNSMMAIFRQSDVPLPWYGWKRFLAGFETDFMAFAALFWALWWSICVDRMYRCQDMSGNIFSLALKPVLRHSSLIFENYCGYFSLIGRTVAKILAKAFLRGLWPPSLEWS